MRLTSPAFRDGESIPVRYSQFGEDINPPLAWNDVPEGTRSFALVMDDPDVPPAAGVPVWDHWVVWNIPASVRNIPEAWNVDGVLGSGTRGEQKYSGPRPPDREHRYFFKLYALDATLGLSPGSSKQELQTAMQGHVLSEAALMGRFAPIP